MLKGFWKRVLTFTLATSIAIFSNVGLSRAADEYPWNYTLALKYADLVVRGVIVDYETMVVPYEEYNPSTKHKDARLPITVLHLRVLEVMNGSWGDEQLSVVAPGNYPDGVPNDSGVIVRMHGYTYNYKIGDEVIMALRFLDSMRGGSYVVGPDQTRFIRTEYGFENQGDKQIVMTLEDIKAITDSVKYNVVFREADLVATGTIVDVTGESPPRTYEEKEFSIKLDEVWKGNYDGKVLKFKMITRGGYDRPEKPIVPDIFDGERWLVFLQKDSNGYYPFAGSNGLFKIVGQELIRNNRVKLSMSEADFGVKLVGETENE